MKSKISERSTARAVGPTAPPWHPGLLVCLSKPLARSQRRTAARFVMGRVFTGALVLPDQTGHGANVFNPPVEIGVRFGKTE